MIKKNNEKVFFDYIRELIVKPKIVNKNDIGVYKYKWSCDSFHENYTGLTYEVFIKLRALEVYEDLVEIELIDIKVNDSASQDVINLITNNFPKFINPKFIKWEIKSKINEKQKV